jgi:transcriptional regulator with XRE-family HTH domain
LAREADVSKGFASAVENGHNQPSGKVLLKLAKALGASVDYLPATR